MIFIVSTLNERFDHVVANLNSENVVVVNQGSSSGRYSSIKFAGIIYDDGLGLSRSRNIGLDFCTKKNLELPWVVCDDDVIYNFNVVTEIRKLPSVMALFQGRISLPCGLPFKNYDSRPTLFRYYKSLFGISSVEMIITDSELSKLVRFDERFGLGSVNAFGGEECLFLKEWLSRGGSYSQSSIMLGVHPLVSTGTRVDEMGYWSTRKNLFKELFGFFWLLIFVLFLAKKTRSSKIFSSGLKGLFHEK